MIRVIFINTEYIFMNLFKIFKNLYFRNLIECNRLCFVFQNCKFFSVYNFFIISILFYPERQLLFDLLMGEFCKVKVFMLFNSYIRKIKSV
jgi:hypothetical protein